MSSAVKKPQLRGMLTRQILRNLGVTFGIIVATITTLRFTLVQRRKNAYAQYYSNLDSEALFNEMKQAGVFQSVPPDDDKKEENPDESSQAKDAKNKPAVEDKEDKKDKKKGKKKA